MPKDIKTLTLKEIATLHSQLKKINNEPYVSLIELAKELGVKKTDLLTFIENHSTCFVLKAVEKKPLLILGAFEDDADNIVNKDKYIEKRKNLNKNLLHLSEMNNYGSISGYYIEPSKDKHSFESQHLNTLSKITHLQERFSLKPASYYIGGFGDCSLIKPENGFQIHEQHILELINEGWEIAPDPNTLKWKNG